MICNAGTTHDTMTGVALCNAGNPSFACRTALIATIKTEVVSEVRHRAINNLRSRFGCACGHEVFNHPSVGVCEGMNA